MNSSRCAALSRNVCAILLLVLLAACASPQRKPLSPSVLPIAQTLPVEIYFGQQELLIESQSTNAMAGGGGLIGALIAVSIDNVAAKRDERRAGPIRDLLIDRDPRAHALERIRADLNAVPLAAALVFEDFPEGARAALARGAVAPRAQVLVIEGGYSLTFDLRSLRVWLAADYYQRRVPKDERLRDRPAYTTRVEHLFPLPGDESTLNEDERAERWLAFGSALADRIEDGFDEAVAMLNHDLATAAQPPAGGDVVKYQLGALAAGHGPVERTADDRRWIRSRPWLLVSVPQ